MSQINHTGSPSRQFRKPGNILVTGGCGFIGSNFIHYIFNETGFDGNIVNVDKLTYAGNAESLAEVEHSFGEESKKRYSFVHADICDFKVIEKIFIDNQIDTVVHFAAESHVDRSIHGPTEFIQTNIIGTFNLLEIARKHWRGREDVLFHHISTDEVFGSLGDTGYFVEDTPYDPRSPYSASKASSDHLVNAYFHTYGLPVTISNCSNNYGPYQFPEKLVPLMILNAMEGKKLPVYGEGKNVRDWLFVTDHCDAIYRIIENGKTGHTYNVGGENEEQNIDVVHKICDIMEELSPLDGPGNYKDLITFVTDRAGHDWRYAIDCSKLKRELGWKPSVSFEQGLRRTVQWYLENSEWIDHIRSGEYKKWIHKHYENR